MLSVKGLILCVKYLPIKPICSTSSPSFPSYFLYVLNRKNAAIGSGLDGRRPAAGRSDTEDSEPI